MSSFLEIIKSTTSNSIGSLVKKIKKNNDFFNFVLDNTFYMEDSCNISFRLYHLRNNLTSQIKCKNCKSLLYSQKTFCSKRCAAIINQKLESVIEKKSKSISDNYNNKTEEEKQNIKEKRKSTNIERFGVDTNLKLDSNIEKTKKTWIEKYGFDNPNKSELIKNKISESNKNKTEDEKKSIDDIRRSTNIERYGEDNIMKTDLGKLKIIETNTERYGESHPMKNEEFYENYFNNSYRKFKFKKYELPSGKIVNLLGYESQILDYLLTKFDENDIIIGYESYKIVKSNYLDNGKLKRYIPDFYIKSKNLVIEVKSDYTYLTVDKQKRISVSDKFIKFIYAIYDIKEKTIKFKRYE